MRTVVVCPSAVAILLLACASAPTAGPLGEGTLPSPRITAVDSVHPPTSASVELQQPGYAALLLVAPGHSATLLYPSDSVMANRFDAGSHLLTFRFPPLLIEADSAGLRMPPARTRNDTTFRGPTGRQRSDTSFRSRSRITPLPASTPVFLLLVTAPQRLDYRRITEKTTGVSIPVDAVEALNAVAKAVKSTLTAEPREWAAVYERVDIHASRK